MLSSRTRSPEGQRPVTNPSSMQPSAKSHAMTLPQLNPNIPVIQELDLKIIMTNLWWRCVFLE
jgi:hypothetical protein